MVSLLWGIHKQLTISMFYSGVTIHHYICNSYSDSPRYAYHVVALCISLAGNTSSKGEKQHYTSNLAAVHKV